MALIRLTKEFHFELAHALEGYDGACRNIHGHSYVLYVTVIGSPIDSEANPKLGMIMDFGDLKKIVNENIINHFDHALLLNQKSSMLKTLRSENFGKVEALPFQPTCENLLPYIAEQISSRLPDGVKLHHIKLNETATSFAEWYASDNP
jgi:6-pyruvoyltetrahydropterin/6-carboxytetrahydropterin synthase